MLDHVSCHVLQRHLLRATVTRGRSAAHLLATVAGFQIPGLEHRIEFQGSKGLVRGDELLWIGDPPAFIEGTLQPLWSQLDLGPGFSSPTSSLTSLLWSGVAFMSQQRRNKEATLAPALKLLLQELVVILCGRMDGWAMAQPTPSIARMAETQPKGPTGQRRKRLGFFLQSKIGSKKRARLSTEDSNVPGSSAMQAMLREACLYQAEVRWVFANAQWLELIFDGSRFGGLEMEIAVFFHMRENVAAFLPPQKMRELAWRKEGAGSFMDSARRSFRNLSRRRH